MPIVPAFCDTCGTAFSSGMLFDNASNITLSGCRAGPCPKCGGMGHIPDGVFNFVGSSIEILSAPHRTVRELTRLMEILRDARHAQTQPEEVADQIRSEVPSLAPLLAVLPTNRSEWYAFLAVLLAVVQIYLAANPPGSTPPQQININQVIQQTLANDAPSDRANAAKRSSPKVGRNSPCPCGSGKKYKKCCLGHQ